MARIDPNAAARPGSGIFGLDDTLESAGVHVLPVPFDATTSYRKGAARGPAAVLAASHQVDLLDLWTGRPYEAGIWMAPIDPRVEALNEEAGALADAVIERGGPGDDPELAVAVARVDEIQGVIQDGLRAQAAAALEAGKLVGVLGGDHSVPFGAIQAHAERFPGMGLLHVDAHADLRRAYEGFTWSHASILRNVVERIDGVGPILQVGIRDLCDEELAVLQGSGGRLRAVFDRDWFTAKHAGRPLVDLVRASLAFLPRDVYVSFDVDGLDPAYCPSTGTPVPGGLTWDEAMLWLEELVRSGRRIVGFDLTEVAPAAGVEPGQGWDEIVGARLLYRLIGFALRSRDAGAAP